MKAILWRTFVFVTSPIWIPGLFILVVGHFAAIFIAWPFYWIATGRSIEQLTGERDW